LAVEAQLAPQELQVDLIKASTTNLAEGSDDDKEFERRIRVAELAMKEKEMEAKNRKVQAETKNLDANNQAEQKLMEMLNNGL
jgi:hypothetical protein